MTVAMNKTGQGFKGFWLSGRFYRRATLARRSTGAALAVLRRWREQNEGARGVEREEALILRAVATAHERAKLRHAAESFRSEAGQAVAGADTTAPMTEGECDYSGE